MHSVCVCISFLLWSTIILVLMKIVIFILFMKYKCSATVDSLLHFLNKTYTLMTNKKIQNQNRFDKMKWWNLWKQSKNERISKSIEMQLVGRMFSFLLKHFYFYIKIINCLVFAQFHLNSVLIYSMPFFLNNSLAI